MDMVTDMSVHDWVQPFEDIMDAMKLNYCGHLVKKKNNLEKQIIYEQFSKGRSKNVTEGVKFKL